MIFLVCQDGVPFAAYPSLSEAEIAVMGLPAGLNDSLSIIMVPIGPTCWVNSDGSKVKADAGTRRFSGGCLASPLPCPLSEQI